MIPPLLDAMRRVFRGESAIDGLVRINQMGATLSQVRGDWLYLWLLAAIYFHPRCTSGAPSGVDRDCQCPLELAATLHTIAVLGALAGAAGILLFLILGSGVAPQRAPGWCTPPRSKFPRK
jgi:hypothetical protein